MERSPEYSANTLLSTDSGTQRPVKAANIVYQTLTIAAMLILLGSLLVF